MPDRELLHSLEEAEVRAIQHLSEQIPDGALGWPAWSGGDPDPWTTGQILCLDFSASKTARRAATNATQWLETQQNPWRGSWPGLDFHGEPHVQSTAFAVLGLTNQLSHSPSIEAGQEWLASTSRGGWQSIPDTPEQHVNSLHRYATAVAIRALLSGTRRSARLDTAHQAIQTLREQRAPDSPGWGNYDDNPADVTFTCFVLHALLDAKDATPKGVPHNLIEPAVEWIRTQQEPTAGTWDDWQDFDPSAEGTAYASYILMRSEGRVSEHSSMGLRALLDMQNDNGGWELGESLASSSGQNWVTYTGLLAIQFAITLLKGSPREIQDAPSNDLLALYETRTLSDLAAIPSPRPMEHTMFGSLDDYVDRKIPNLANALARKCDFEVHGIYPDHCRAVLGSQGYSKFYTLNFQPKSHKKWNGIRPKFFYANKPEGQRILGCAVPPGEDYLLHYASMLRHIVTKLSNSQRNVSAFRYRSAEKNIFRYMGLSESIVRAGDTVVVGYVEEMAGRLTQLDWQPFLTETKELGGWVAPSASGHRIVLLGVAFSYWGSLAYHLATDIFNLGASELLYVGKLGTLTTAKDIYTKPFCPSEFALASLTNAQLVAKSIRNSLLQNNPGLDTGVHASVPTVLEEDYHQRRALDDIGAQTIDNEISQMALAAEQASHRGLRVRFGCCHFATDYLRTEDEADVETTFDLANHRNNAAKTAKDLILARIIDDVIAPHLNG